MKGMKLVSTAVPTADARSKPTGKPNSWATALVHSPRDVTRHPDPKQSQRVTSNAQSNHPRLYKHREKIAALITNTRVQKCLVVGRPSFPIPAVVLSVRPDGGRPVLS